MSRTPRVKEYMTKDVVTVSPSDRITVLKNKLVNTGHDGFPVCSENSNQCKELNGYIKASDIVTKEGEIVKEIMQTSIPTIEESIKTTSAARVMFREGITEICVLDSDSNFVGIISNTDIIRSTIERTTPTRVQKTRKLLRNVHNVNNLRTIKEEVFVDDLQPTQNRIFKDELKGRKYELENGLAEPIIVVDTRHLKVLVDGHHRAVAAQELGEISLNAWVIQLPESVQLGMVENAREQGIRKVDDIRVEENGDSLVFEIPGSN